MMPRCSRRWVVVLALPRALPATVAGAPSSQGMSLQGHARCKGMSLQGHVVAGAAPRRACRCKGMSLQGMLAAGAARCKACRCKGSRRRGLAARHAGVGRRADGDGSAGSRAAGVDIASVDVRGTTADSAVRAFELTSAPASAPARAITSPSAARPRPDTTRWPISSTPAGNAAEDLDLYIADERPDPAPNLLHRGDAQINEDVTLYTVFVFHACDRTVGLALSLRRRHRRRHRDGDRRGSDDAQSVHLRLHRQRRRVEVRACLGIPPLAQRAKRRLRRRHRRLGRTDVRAEAVLRRVQARGARGLLPGSPELHARTARWSICSTPASSSGRMRSRTRSAERPDSRWMFAQEHFVSGRSAGGSPDAQGLGAAAHALPRAVAGRASAPSWPSSIAWSRTISKTDAGPARSRTRRASRCSRPTTAGTTSTRRARRCRGTAARARRRSARPSRAAAASDRGAGLGRACVAQADCDRRRQWPPGRVWPRDLPPTTAGRRAKYPARPGRRGRARRRRSGAARATLAGWACDPEWPGAAVTVAIYGGAPREQPGSALLGDGTRRPGAGVAAVARGQRRLRWPAPRLPRATDSPSRCRRTAPATFFVYAIDAATADGPAAPPTLLRNGIVARSALRAQRARDGRGAGRELQRLRRQRLRRRSARRLLHDAVDGRVRRGGDSCAPGDSSAPANSRSFAAVTTGWIEAPVTRHLRLRVVAAAEPPVRQRHHRARLVRDLARDRPAERSRWQRASATTCAGIACRPSRRRARRGPGLTWQLPGDGRPDGDSVRRISTRSRPAAATGLTATYFTGPGFGGASSRGPTRTSTSTRTSRRPGRRRWTCRPATARRTRRSGTARSFRRSREDYTFYVGRQRHRAPDDRRRGGRRFRRPPLVERAGRLRPRPVHARRQAGRHAATAACTTICAQGSRTAATAATCRTTRPSPSGTRAASPRWRRTAPDRSARAASRPRARPRRSP